MKMFGCTFDSDSPPQKSRLAIPVLEARLDPQYSPISLKDGAVRLSYKEPASTCISLSL